MEKIPVWLDCDTGTDDAVAILALHALDEIDLLGISAVCGNTSLENAFCNTHRVCALTGARYPIYRGAAKPLHCKPTAAAAFHGSNGLGDVELPMPEDARILTEAGWDEYELYRDGSANGETPIKALFVPYYAWNNRGDGEMLVWVREK